MSNIHEPIIVNILGHSAGAIIFGIFGYLILRDRGEMRLRRNWLSAAAAGLAFLWNLASLAVLLTLVHTSHSSHLLIFFSFSVLSLLPAVLLHLSLDEGRFRAVIVCGYVLSLIAIGMHLRELLQPGFQYQRQALLIITVGFAILTIVCIAAVIFRGGDTRRAKASRIFGTMCASLLAVSFVHFGAGHPPHAWSSELVLHHGGIPLALFVLLQDYRFVLLDAFVRFLANVLVAAVLTFVTIRITFQWLEVDERFYQNPTNEALLLLSLSILLIGFVLVRSHIQKLLTRVVFRRPDLDKALREVESHGTLFEEESEFIVWAAAHLGWFVSANRVEVVPEERLNHLPSITTIVSPAALASDVRMLRYEPAFSWVEAMIPLRLDHADLRFLLFGRRLGGRRYLSEDLLALSRLTAAIVEHVARFRTSEMQRLVSQAELRALQSQINPHFLFNALNTLYGIIPREALGARKTVLNLSEIFRYFLQTERTFIRLADELEIVKSYLEIERLRLGPRMETQIEIDAAALQVQIPVLSIQPLVENAIKHGLAAKEGRGILRLSAKVQGVEVIISVQDTGPGITDQPRSLGRSGTGVGLANVRRRLQLCFGQSADIIVDSSPAGTNVRFAVPCDPFVLPPPTRARSGQSVDRGILPVS